MVQMVRRKGSEQGRKHGVAAHSGSGLSTPSGDRNPNKDLQTQLDQPDPFPSKGKNLGTLSQEVKTE